MKSFIAAATVAGLATIASASAVAPAPVSVSATASASAVYCDDTCNKKAEECRLAAKDEIERGVCNANRTKCVETSKCLDGPPTYVPSGDAGLCDEICNRQWKECGEKAKSEDESAVCNATRNTCLSSSSCREEAKTGPVDNKISKECGKACPTTVRDACVKAGKNDAERAICTVTYDICLIDNKCKTGGDATKKPEVSPSAIPGTNTVGIATATGTTPIKPIKPTASTGLPRTTDVPVVVAGAVVNFVSLGAAALAALVAF